MPSDQFVDVNKLITHGKGGQDTKKPRNLRCEAVPSPGYVTVVAQRIRG